MIDVRHHRGRNGAALGWQEVRAAAAARACLREPLGVGMALYAKRFAREACSVALFLTHRLIAKRPSMQRLSEDSFKFI